MLEEHDLRNAETGVEGEDIGEGVFDSAAWVADYYCFEGCEGEDGEGVGAGV